MKHYRRLLQLLRPYKRRLLIGSLCLIITSLTNLAAPLYIKRLVDVVMVQKNLEALNAIAVMIALLFIVQLLFSTAHNYLFDFTEKRVMADFRKKLFSHLQTLSLSFFVKRRTGEIVSRMTNDVSTIEGIITDLPATALQQAIRLVGGIVIIVYMNWKLTFMVLALTPVLVLFARTFGRKLKRLSTEIQDKLAASTIVLEENISCVQMVKSFVQESFEMERFSTAVENSFQAARKRVQIASFFGPAIGFIAFSTSLALLWFGGKQVITGTMSPGELIAFILYATIIAGPMGSFARMFTRLQEGMGAGQRLFEIFDTQPEVRDNPDAHAIPPIKGRLEVSRLRFHYRADQEVLHDITFSVEPGKMVALVGPSGAGKSTLVQLLHRFYDPTAGEIRIDSIPLKDIQLASYWKQIGLVPQETILFGGTIEENIRYAKIDATHEEIVASAHIANAHKFIIDCPDGYKTIVGEKGIRLSAGQRQRIAIARAVLKDPRILFLDEATSSLDNESEMLIQEALERLMKGRTSFVIAHRLSTIHNADIIFVLDQGRIVESGTHADLIGQKGLYHYLYTLKTLRQGQESKEVETF